VARTIWIGRVLTVSMWGGSCDDFGFMVSPWCSFRDGVSVSPLNRITDEWVGASGTQCIVRNARKTGTNPEFWYAK